jgi:hypothetical protein
MGSQRQEPRDVRDVSDDELALPASSRPRRPGWFWPMMALAFTTACLAASAFRVVASAIGEGKPQASSEPACSAPDSTPSQDPCLVENAEPEQLASSDDPSPPRLSVSTTSKSPEVRGEKLAAAPTPPSDGKSAKHDSKDAKKAIAPAPASLNPTIVSAPSVAAPSKPRADHKRILVRDPRGKPVVARVLGRDGERTAAILPDGQVGWPDGLIYTEKPFVPASMEAMKTELSAGEYAGFFALETRHYLVFYEGTRKFAQDSVTTLENLYAKLSTVLNKRDVPVHEAEFPLVVVIYATEDDFRRRKRVAPDVQAYFEIMSNRIFLYESSKRDQTEPEVSALRKPQTVAHEGTHQILQNIGVQPRLSNWPLWLVEGLAEYCASPRLVGKKALPTWVGLGQPNILHIATIRDLSDPLSTQVVGAGGPAIHRKPGQPLVEYVVTRMELSPTDYALSWALTYHLALKRVDDFLDFLREMGRMEPFEVKTPADHLRAFKAAFGDRLGKLDKDVSDHIGRLKQADALPYYAVMFAQPMPGGILRRAALVSRSPSVIRQWIETSTMPNGEDPHWQILPQPTQAGAFTLAEQWMGNGS